MSSLTCALPKLLTGDPYPSYIYQKCNIQEIDILTLYKFGYYMHSTKKKSSGTKACKLTKMKSWYYKLNEAKKKSSDSYKSTKILGIIIRAVLRWSKVSGFHPETLLEHDNLVNIIIYKIAMLKQNFRIKSGNFASAKYYPGWRMLLFFIGLRVNLIWMEKWGTITFTPLFQSTPSILICYSHASVIFHLHRWFQKSVTSFHTQ
jgi:hypothetical protein